MNRFLIIFGIWSLSQACTTVPLDIGEVSSETNADAVLADEADNEDSKKFFPGFVFDKIIHRPDGTTVWLGGELRRNWYGRQLRALNEKSLISRLDPDTLYLRFLWLRTFDNPVCPSSNNLGRLSVFPNGGSGSSWVPV